MKSKSMFLALLIAAMVGGVCQPAFASVGVKDKTGKDLGAATDIQTEGTISGSKLVMQDAQREIPLEIGSFLSVPGSGTSFASPVGANTSPDLRYSNQAAFIRWTSIITSKAEKKFRVPNNYVSGGTFKVLVGRSGMTALPPQLAYQVFINKDSTAYDVTATSQTSSTLSQNIGNGSPEEKTLSVTTDFDALAAGNIVTIDFWRDNANSSTEDLQLYYASFVYTAAE